jgi:hypothetical protein
MNYSDELVVRDALEVYFLRSGFNSDSYFDRWVKLPLGPFRIYLPNFSARRKAVPLHDIDHVLTEYNTDWRGEFQISAYEIGTGCGKYWAAWFINLQGIILGSLLFPRDSVRAFARGRRSKGVFGYPSHEPLLSCRVGELRQNLTLPDQFTVSNFSDFVLLYLISGSATLLFVSPAILLTGLFLLRY